MAKLRGGLFGRPSGQVQNLVIGAARDRMGKVPTVRELVIPSNPQTAPQTLQRHKFQNSLEIVRAIGPTEYQDVWNRSIGQLPGFQSLMSIFLNAIDDDLELTAPPDTLLGTLHAPDTYTAGQGGASGEIDVTWSTELGSNGTAADTVSCWCFSVAPNAADKHTVYNASGMVVRSAGTLTIEDLVSADSYLIWLYFEGSGAADGLVSPAQWVIAAAE